LVNKLFYLCKIQSLNRLPMRIFLFFFVAMAILLGNTIYAQITISSGKLGITITNNGNGITISHIKDNNTELLNPNTVTDIFSLSLINIATGSTETIGASTGWGNINIISNQSSCTIIMTNPINVNIASSLQATLSISTNDEKSSWDLSVTGIGQNHSLNDVIFPAINIKAAGNDTFLYPLYSGKLIINPGSGIDFFDDSNDNSDNNVGIYPRGWGTTMQFFSYYNSSYGIYFGFHDSVASLKKFGIKNENGGIKIQCTTPAGNKTKAGNNWQMPGHFELDLFNGTWYDAALIYKKWVSGSASYWPVETPSRKLRQHKAGEIGIWLTSHLSDASIPQMQNYIQTAANFFDFPVGVHIYKWNYFDYDHYYPRYFPERAGLDTLVNNLQKNGDIIIMPYINGRLWDTGIGGNDPEDSITAAYFNNNGIGGAAKHNDGTYYSETFMSNKFATMCPTDTLWQNLMTDISLQLTQKGRIGAKSLYIDMISASAAVQCMDSTHNHPLGGGHYWTEGYTKLLQRIHDSIGTEDFITVEGGCDFLAGQVDAFMVQGWMTGNQVPAWQTIYSGKVQLFGTRTGGSMYGDQRFYGRLSQGFIYGVQTGRQYIWLAINPSQNSEKLMAANYVKALGRLRYKLRYFMSYGEMKRPLTLTGNIPDISYTVMDWGGCRCTDTISNPAIRNSVWQNDSAVVLVFSNARIQSPAGVPGGNINFTFDFDPADYGLQGPLTIQKITPDFDDSIITINNAPFQKNVSLPNLNLVAYKITASGHSGFKSTGRTVKLHIYPNPADDYFKIIYNGNIDNVEIYNYLGQIVMKVKPEKNTVGIRNLSAGFYQIILWDNDKQFVSKIIKK